MPKSFPRWGKSRPPSPQSDTLRSSCLSVYQHIIFHLQDPIPPVHFFGDLTGFYFSFLFSCLCLWSCLCLCVSVSSLGPWTKNFSASKHGLCLTPSVSGVSSTHQVSPQVLKPLLHVVAGSSDRNSGPRRLSPECVLLPYGRLHPLPSYSRTSLTTSGLLRFPVPDSFPVV